MAPLDEKAAWAETVAARDSKESTESSGRESTKSSRFSQENLEDSLGQNLDSSDLLRGLKGGGNFTQIPNVIFDHWMKFLSPSDFKVFMVICRKIYGWHKSNDSVSLQQLVKITGLTRPTIVKSIGRLVSRGMINKVKSKTQAGDDASSSYSINLEFLCQIGGTKNALPRSKDGFVGTENVLPGVGKSVNHGSKEDLPGVVKENTNGGSQNALPTKETPNTKDTLLKESLTKDSSSSESKNGIAQEEEELTNPIKRKTLIDLNPTVDELQEARDALARRKKSMPDTPIVDDNKWLAATIENKRNVLLKEQADSKRVEEEEWKCREELQARKEECERAAKEKKSREYEENRALALSLPHSSCIELKERCILLKHKDKSQGNMVLGFDDPDFKDLVAKFIQEEGYEK